MHTEDEAHSRRVQEVMARVDAAIKETHENLKRCDEKRARVYAGNADVEKALSFLSPKARDHILALGQKYAHRDVTNPTNPNPNSGAQPVAAPKAPKASKAPRQMI